MEGYDDYDAPAQACESDEESLFYDHDMSGSVLNLGFHHLQVKPQTALVFSQFD